MSSTDPTSRRTPRRTKTKAADEAEPARVGGQRVDSPPDVPADATITEGSESFDMPGARGYSDAEWHAMVAQAAYLRAEQRGFVEGSPEQDWLEAEEELRRMLSRPGA